VKPAKVVQTRVDPSIHARLRHIARDHSYVLGEVRLIALLMAFIIGGLVITAILR